MSIGKFLNKYIFKLNVAIATALLLAYLTAYFEPRQMGVLTFFGLFYPFLLALNILFILYWLILKSKNLFLSGLIVLLGYGFMTNYVAVNNGNNIEDTSDVKLLTFNTTAFISWNEETGHQIRPENKEAFASVVEDQDPDLIFLQEKIRNTNKIINKKNEYPYHGKLNTSRLGIYSKYKLGPFTLKKFDNYTNGVLSADWYLPQDTIQLINVHLTSNKIRGKTLNKLKTDNLDDRETWSALKTSMGSYLRATKLRVTDYHYIDSLIQSSPHRSIIAGDFNEVAMSHLYHNLSSTHTDAFKEAGNGISATYKKLMGALRIDYIFVDPSMQVTKYDVIKPSFSDHYPVIAHISLASQADN